MSLKFQQFELTWIPEEPAIKYMVIVHRKKTICFHDMLAPNNFSGKATLYSDDCNCPPSLKDYYD